MNELAVSVYKDKKKHVLFICNRKPKLEALSKKRISGRQVCEKGVICRLRIFSAIGIRKK